MDATRDRLHVEAPAAEPIIVLSRSFNAPRRLVWKVMTEPEHIARWWGPRSVRTTVARHDFRVGGAWRYEHHMADGTVYAFKGEFREIVPDERLVMNRHPEIGAEILGRSRIPLFQLAAEVALCHHERWDGTGYPRGLAGEAIPLSARIVSVTDFCDALTMDRCYRPAFTTDDALDMLVVQRGRAFDPRVVDAFIAHADELFALRARIDEDPPSDDDLLGAA